MCANDYKKLNDYYKNIKRLLPVYTKYERYFLNTLKINIDEFISTNTNCNFFDIVSNFGLPTNLVAQYFDNISTKQLNKELCVSKIIKGCISFCMISILLYCLFSFGILLWGKAEEIDLYKHRTIIENYIDKDKPNE